MSRSTSQEKTVLAIVNDLHQLRADLAAANFASMRLAVFRGEQRLTMVFLGLPCSKGNAIVQSPPPALLAIQSAAYALLDRAGAMLGRLLPYLPKHLSYRDWLARNESGTLLWCAYLCTGKRILHSQSHGGGGTWFDNPALASIEAVDQLIAQVNEYLVNLKSDSPVADKKAMTKTEQIRRQRNKFSAPRIGKSMSWPEIYDEYVDAVKKNKASWVADPKVSADALRLTWTRNPDVQ